MIAIEIRYTIPIGIRIETGCMTVTLRTTRSVWGTARCQAAGGTAADPVQAAALAVAELVVAELVGEAAADVNADLPNWSAREGYARGEYLPSLAGRLTGAGSLLTTRAMPQPHPQHVDGHAA